MDLNSLSLPAVVLTELYGGVLLDTAETDANSPPVTSPAAEPRQANGSNQPNGLGGWLGNNQKNILVLVRYSDAVYLPDRQFDFLTGMLNACKLGIADVAIVNLDKYGGAGYKELIKEFKTKVVLLFDIEPAFLGLPINFPHYQIQPFANNSFLYAPSLDVLEADKIQKSKLWVCLRRLFNI